MEKSKNVFQRIMSRYSKAQKKDMPFAYLVVAIPVLHFILFWFYVNFSSFVLAFQDYQGAFTLDNFETVYNAFVDADPTGKFNLLDSLGRSLLLWVLSLTICFPSSLITVYVLTCKIRLHYFYRVCYILPGLIGSIIWTTIVKLMFKQRGPIVNIFQGLGFNLPQDTLRDGFFGAAETAFPALLIFTVLLSLVGDSPVITGAYARVSDELMESADLDGAGFWTKLFAIAIPCIWPTITTLLIFRLCGIFTADCNVFLYSNGTGGPGGSMSTMGFQLFYLTYEISQNGGNRQAYGYPAALGFTLTCATLPICLIGRHYLEKLNDVVS